MTIPSTFRTMRAFTRTMAKWQWDKSKHGALRTLADGHCPITAVTQSATGERFSNQDYYEAGERLHLPHTLRERIMEGADNVGTMESRKIRRILLRAARLNQ